jgi:putative membrane protein
MTEGISRNDPRVRLAAERTLLAWIRTGLAMMGFGFVVARFGVFLRNLSDLGSPQESFAFAHWMGVALVGLGSVVTSATAWQHFKFARSISHGVRDGMPNRYFGVVVAIVLSGIGFLLVAYLSRSGH